MTLAQAMPQIWTLTLPVGAFGKARIHSTYPGTQPCGIQKRGCFAYHNCRKKRRPLVTSQRTEATAVSNEARAERRAESGGRNNKVSLSEVA